MADITIKNKKTKDQSDSYAAAASCALVWCILIYCAVKEVGIIYTILNFGVSFGAYLAGNAFRKFTAPDAFVSRGAWDTFCKKVFWIIGPQLIAMALGSFILYAIIYNN